MVLQPEGRRWMVLQMDATQLQPIIIPSTRASVRLDMYEIDARIGGEREGRRYSWLHASCSEPRCAIKAFLHAAMQAVPEDQEDTLSQHLDAMEAMFTQRGVQGDGMGNSVSLHVRHAEAVMHVPMPTPFHATQQPAESNGRCAASKSVKGSGLARCQLNTGRVYQG